MLPIKVLLLIARFTLGFENRETASLSKSDIERYTGLRGSTVLATEKSLVESKLVEKIQGDKFTANKLKIASKTPPSNNPPTTPPTPPQPPKTKTPAPLNPAPVDSAPQGTNSPNPVGTKNTSPSGINSASPEGPKSAHFIESFSKSSFKKSLSKSPEFPSDMIERWNAFEKSGNYGKAKNEREIFQTLFLKHKEPFFENCGKVVAFLESQGNGKAGEAGKIHSPMVWLNGHWDANFARFKAWSARQQALAEVEAQRQAKNAEQQEIDAKERREEEEFEAKMTAGTRRLFQLYPDESERNAFVENMVSTSGLPFVQNSWRKAGWSSPLVRSYVITHFPTIVAGQMAMAATA